MAHKVGRKIRKAVTSPFKRRQRRRPTPKPKPRPKPTPRSRPRHVPKPTRKRAGERLVLTNCRIVKRKPTNDRVWERLGLDTSKHPEIKRYRIKWFSGRWSKWYTPGKDDIDWKGSDRRVWSYFTDHSHEVEQCTVSYDRPEITVTIAPSSAEVGDKLNIEWDGCPDKEMVEVTLYRIAGKPGSVKKGSFPKSLPVEPKPLPLPPPKSKPKKRPSPGTWSKKESKFAYAAGGWVNTSGAGGHRGNWGATFHHKRVKVNGKLQYVRVGSALAKKHNLASTEHIWAQYIRGNKAEHLSARAELVRLGQMKAPKKTGGMLFRFRAPGKVSRHGFVKDRGKKWAGLQAAVERRARAIAEGRSDMDYGRGSIYGNPTW